MGGGMASDTRQSQHTGGVGGVGQGRALEVPQKDSPSKCSLPLFGFSTSHINPIANFAYEALLHGTEVQPQVGACWPYWWLLAPPPQTPPTSRHCKALCCSQQRHNSNEQ